MSHTLKEMDIERGREASEAVATALADAKAQQAITKQEKEYGWMEKLDGFDWKNIPPPQMAMVLTRKPFRGKAGEPDYYLTPAQALWLAMRCFELGVSPLSTEVWFDPKRWTVNVTLEGLKRMAHKENYSFGPPAFERSTRPFPGIAIPGFKEDVGYTCTMRVGLGEHVQYTAWLSEWYIPTSDQWRARPEHMLQVRSQEKAMRFAMGVGVSDLPDEKEIEETVHPTLPEITVKPGKFVEPRTNISLEEKLKKEPQP